MDIYEWLNIHKSRILKVSFTSLFEIFNFVFVTKISEVIFMHLQFYTFQRLKKGRDVEIFKKGFTILNSFRIFLNLNTDI